MVGKGRLNKAWSNDIESGEGWVIGPVPVSADIRKFYCSDSRLVATFS